MGNFPISAGVSLGKTCGTGAVKTTPARAINVVATRAVLLLFIVLAIKEEVSLRSDVRMRVRV